MNNLYKAADQLKIGWCQGMYRDQLSTEQKFCATGALTMTMFPALTNLDADLGSASWDWAWDAVVNSREAKVLAKVIIENYPEAALSVDNSGNYHPTATIIKFNDRIAQSSDEVIAMFEKAAAQLDEMV